MKDLTDLRDSISGVNIDEEMSNLLKFQHGYQAAARFISNWNDMLDTIINRLGV
jgi:flagellar hook-associated protein 1 FlgK